ncbi:putative copine [Helianthus debilis subsp. tardiflorus]
MVLSVTEALAPAGLESSNLILGIDFTKSNEWTAFDEDNLIPCYGFGDGMVLYGSNLFFIIILTYIQVHKNLFNFYLIAASTHDQDVFSFYPEERCYNGFEEVLSRYRELLPHIKLASVISFLTLSSFMLTMRECLFIVTIGPTSFAPVIEKAMTIVEESGGQYHVLVIIADVQVTRSVDTGRGQLSPQEQKTVDAIVEASKLPLSIVLVGVGDGPWDTMKEFDDNIPSRSFDNFQVYQLHIIAHPCFL